MPSVSASLYLVPLKDCSCKKFGAPPPSAFWKTFLIPASMVVLFLLLGGVRLRLRC